MARNIFFVNALLRNERKSISKLSDQLIELLNELGKIDGIFHSFIYSKEGFKDQIVDIHEIGIDDAKKRLGQLILESNEPDIKQHENEANPTLDYARDFGFSHLLRFSLNGKDQFSAIGNLATNNYPDFKLDYFYGDNQYSFSWYKDVLSCIVTVLNPVYAGLIIRLPTFFNPYTELGVKHPFGWITYFSNNYELQIPDDLKGVEYEYADEGKYVILTREDFTTSKEAYEEQRDKLLEIMKEVKAKVPEYSS